MLYVDVAKQKVFNIHDAEVVTEIDGIDRFVSVVEYRQRGSQTLHSRSFGSATDAEAFVNANRGLAAFDKEGKAIPGKYQSLGNWDWFATRPAWFKNAKSS